MADMKLVLHCRDYFGHPLKGECTVIGTLPPTKWHKSHISFASGRLRPKRSLPSNCWTLDLGFGDLDLGLGLRVSTLAAERAQEENESAASAAWLCRLDGVAPLVPQNWLCVHLKFRAQGGPRIAKLTGALVSRILEGSRAYKRQRRSFMMPRGSAAETVRPDNSKLNDCGNKSHNTNSK